MSNVIKDLLVLIKESESYDYLMLFKGPEEAQFLKSFDGFVEVEAPKEGEPLTMLQRLDSCEKCIGASKKKQPFGSGENGLFVILNSPRLLTETEMKIFRNDSIKLMKKMIEAMDLNFDECYITNLIKCDHGSPLLKPSQMIEHCLEFISEEISLKNPSVILVMGDLMPLHDVVHSNNKYSWYSINHPITLLKNPELKSEAWKTMKLVIDSLRKNK